MRTFCYHRVQPAWEVEMRCPGRFAALAAVLLLALPALALRADEKATLKAPTPSNPTTTSPPASKDEPPPAAESNDSTLYHFVTGLDPNGFNWLALRVAPSFHATWSPTVKIAPDTLLKRLGDQGEWMNVALASGDTGWVRARFVACCRKADTPPPGSGDQAKSWITLAGRDIDGGDYGQLNGVAQQDCQDKCRADGRCQSFSYDRWNRVCRLKSALGTLRLDPRVISEVVAKEELADDDQSPVIVQKKSKGFPDSGYSQSSVNTYDDCSKLCLQDDDCNGFNYRQADRVCSLIQVPSEYGTVAGTDLGYKIQSP
jgi:PAN domain-containing protein